MPSKPIDFSRLTQREVAEAFDVTSRTVRYWTQAGLPRNADGTYGLKRACEWWALHRAGHFYEPTKAGIVVTFRRVRGIRGENRCPK
jgi:hypothetical protein